MSDWLRPWRVEIRETGRCGAIAYHEPTGSLTFYSELGSSDSVALIWGESADHWHACHPWAADRRRDILKRVAEEVVRQKAPNCPADIQEPQGLIHIRELD
jgi:hypothetical protein